MSGLFDIYKWSEPTGIYLYSLDDETISSSFEINWLYAENIIYKPIES